jgi:putative FmdB family regulatory protein
MPTYEYQCKECGQRFDQVLTISEHDKHKPRCPQCKSENVEPVFSSLFVKTSRKS